MRLFVLLPALQLRIARYIVEEFEVHVLLEIELVPGSLALRPLRTIIIYK